MIKWFTMGDMTFEEAYRKTGRLFCITVSATTKKAPPVLLNHLSAPNVTLASAIVASAAVPGFVPPVKLQYKMADGSVRESSRDQTYFDGSIDSDIPVNGLAEMLNCQFFVAAQCNPHVVPFFFNSKGGVGRPSRWSSGRHEHSWRGGFLLATLEMYLKNDMKAKFRFLNDMEAAVGFTTSLFTQEFHGSTTLVPQVKLIDFTKVSKASQSASVLLSLRMMITTLFPPIISLTNFYLTLFFCVFQLFSNLNIDDMYRNFQGGSVAAYEHVAMIKMHYRIGDTLDHCLDALHSGRWNPMPDRPVLRINIDRKGEDGQESDPTTCADTGTLSTHSSLDNEDEDGDHSSPSKWEAITKVPK